MASPLILPKGFTKGPTKEALTSDEIALIQRFEAWATKRELKLDLLCDRCYRMGLGPAARCQGNNSRDATVFHVSCACTDRIYGMDVS